ncbi:hypothetical protein ABT56_14095 [Photobacterium aquae]|uniref:Alpha/beta hydrolase n=1 Tax=Photobacterium aquae TaxID=1195763 RepID=A0A0J1GZ08_9GAMM|nr:hypothetical protein ABT56_14095 [Photobacterium aquae]
MKFLTGSCVLLISTCANSASLEIHDDKRNRDIPVLITEPVSTTCTPTKRCPVAIFSAGNKVPHDRYSFLTDKFNEMGYITISINHELPNDPPLSKVGDLYLTRIENWQRGADTINHVVKKLPDYFPNNYDFSNIVLVGHSNGGDISTWLTNMNKDYISTLITLDHKRVPLPRTTGIHVLSINSPEYPTKLGVLYSPEEQEHFGSQVHMIELSKHMDFSDFGTQEVHEKTNKIIEQFLRVQNP